MLLEYRKLLINEHHATINKLDSRTCFKPTEQAL